MLTRFWWLLVLGLVGLGLYLVLRHQTRWVTAVVFVVITYLLGTLLPFVATSGRWTSYRQEAGRLLTSSFVASDLGLRLARAALWLWTIGVVAYLGERIGGLDAWIGAILFVTVTLFLGALAGIAVGPASVFRLLAGRIAPSAGAATPRLDSFIYSFLRRLALIYLAGALIWSAAMVVLIGEKL